MTDAALQLALRAYDNELIFEGRSKVKGQSEDLGIAKNGKKKSEAGISGYNQTRKAENMEGLWVPNERRT